MPTTPANYSRVDCMGGLGDGCPAHAWWYERRHPGSPTKRCYVCRCKMRWLEKEHPTTCCDCGAALPVVGPKRPKGRPRKRCLSCAAHPSRADRVNRRRSHE